MRKNEDAVSPVVGVILMVAITVVLAAIIAAFVFGMGGGLKKTYTVSVTATRDNATNVRVLVAGGPDIASLDSVAIALSQGASTASCSIGTTGDSVALVAGNSTVCALTGASSGTRIHATVTGTFMDGTGQVLLDSDY